MFIGVLFTNLDKSAEEGNIFCLRSFYMSWSKEEKSFAPRSLSKYVLKQLGFSN